MRDARGARGAKVSSCFLALFSSLLLFSVLTVHASVAADYSHIGVKAGDTSGYSEEVNGVKVDSFIVYVKDVAGTLVTLKLTWYSVDGSLNGTSSLIGDVSTGGNAIWRYVVVPSLQVGDALAVGADVSIERTLRTVVAGQSREVNNANFTVTNGWASVYWDKATGVTVRFLLLRSDGMALNRTLVQTTVWAAAGDLTTWLLVGGVAGVAVVAVVAVELYLRKRK